MRTREEVQACVARGAALLDERVPGWEQRITLERLDMNDGTDCILGQVFGWYYDGLEALGLFYPESYGFNATSVWPPDFEDECRMLTVFWKTLLLERRQRA